MDSSRNRQGWAERTGEFSPSYYARLGPNKVSKSLVTLLDHYCSPDASILELGCSSGRHLAHLHESGYENLTGIDINEDAFDVMADSFPALAESGTFHAGAIEHLVPEFEDDAFDVVYSVETLQHVHTDDEWVFEEVARVAADLLVTIENEGPNPQDEATDRVGPEPSDGPDERTVQTASDEFPLYRRDWGQVFTGLGLDQCFCRPGKPDTIRVFRPSDSR